MAGLQAREFIYEQPAFPEPEYTFKHALTQEVAYGSVLAARRKVLHARTAQAIEELFRYNLDAHYAELAHHYSRTDNAAKAVEYLRLAGIQAAARGAYEEAVAQLSRGLELLRELPEGAEREQQELLLQLALGPALMTTTGYTVPEVETRTAVPPRSARGLGKARSCGKRCMACGTSITFGPICSTRAVWRSNSSSPHDRQTMHGASSWATTQWGPPSTGRAN